MTGDTTTADIDSTDTVTEYLPSPVSLVLVGVLAIGFMAAIEPAAAAEGARSLVAPPKVCSNKGMQFFKDLISGWINISAALGTMMMVAVWQADALAELVTGTEEGKKRVKRHKRTVAKSGLTLLLLGPGVTAAGIAMNIPFFQCVDLLPF